MLSVLFAAGLLTVAQPDLSAPAEPSVECAAHLTDERARLSCLENLLDAAGDALGDAQSAAREDARESDLDSGGMFSAADKLDSAQVAWLAYRDAECERRSALMFLGASSRRETDLNCQIRLTRARAEELRAH